MVGRLDRQCKQWDMLILVILLLLMSVTTGICNQASIFEVFAFFAFQMLCVLLPGSAVMTLMPIRHIRRIENLTLIYAAGYILTILIYSVLMVARGDGYIRIFLVFIAVLSVCVLLKRKHMDGIESNEDQVRESSLWIWIILFFFGVSLFVFSLRWKIPQNGGSNYYETDFLYWVGDIVALTKKVPPVNFRTLASDYRYHYFGALQQAVISRVTGISAIKVASCFSYIESAVLVGLSTYSIISRVIENRIAQMLTAILMLFSTGYENVAGATYIWHMYLVPMSYNIAQSMGLIVVLLLLLQSEEKEIDRNNFLLSLLCLICCVGTKTAAGAVILCGFVCMYLFLLLSRCGKKTTYLVIGALSVAFLLLGLYFWPTVQAYQISLHVPDISFMGIGKTALTIYKCIDWIYGYMGMLAEFNFWTFVPACIYGVYLFKHKKIRKEHVLFLIFIFIGMLGTYIVHFSSNSQMYFAFIAFPFAGLLTGCCVEELFSRFLSVKKQYMVTGAICVMMVCFMLCANYKSYFLEFFKMGVSNINVPNAVYVGDYIYSVSYAEYQAYAWIADHTDENAVLLSDRTLERVENPVGVMSERYVYYFTDMESGKACFAGDEDALRLYSEKDIDYIVQTKRLSPSFYCPEDVGEIVFENEEVAVFRLR